MITSGVMVYILGCGSLPLLFPSIIITYHFQVQAHSRIMTTITLRFIILLALIFILAPSVMAFSPYMPCRVACNTAYLSCMHVYGMSHVSHVVWPIADDQAIPLSVISALCSVSDDVDDTFRPNFYSSSALNRTPYSRRPRYPVDNHLCTTYQFPIQLIRQYLSPQLPSPSHLVYHQYTQQPNTFIPPLPIPTI
jgi:hypothetical protein